MKNRLLFIDTETGGVDPSECSLFSIGFIVWEDGKIIFEKEIFIKDTIYKTTSTAIKLNNIDISKLDEIGVLQIKVTEEIENIKKEYFNDEPMTVAGHNVGFDTSFIKQLYKNSNKNYYNDFSHRMIDTASILQFLYYSGILPENLAASDKAFGYFNIRIEKRHDSLEDCRATAILFNKLINIYK
jgi:DNA polymerase-3 subunit epsilon